MFLRIEYRARYINLVGALKISSQDGARLALYFFAGFLQRWKCQHARMPRSAAIRQSEPPSIMWKSLYCSETRISSTAGAIFPSGGQIFAPPLLNSARHQRPKMIWSMFLHIYDVRPAVSRTSLIILYICSTVILAPAREVAVCASQVSSARTKWGKFDRNCAPRHLPRIYFQKSSAFSALWRKSHFTPRHNSPLSVRHTPWNFELYETRLFSMYEKISLPDRLSSSVLSRTAVYIMQNHDSSLNVKVLRVVFDDLQKFKDSTNWCAARSHCYSCRYWG